jgi:hypothetical protein
VLTLANGLAFALGGINAAGKLHASALARVLRAPVSFFDTTPLGRILNRFSSDVSVIDKDLPAAFSSFAQLSSRVAATLIVQAVILPWTLVGVLPVAVFYLGVQNFYRSSSRELKRLEQASKSPVVAHLSESLAGASTIRSYHEGPRFAAEFSRRLDKSNHVSFLSGILINR